MSPCESASLAQSGWGFVLLATGVREARVVLVDFRIAIIFPYSTYSLYSPYSSSWQIFPIFVVLGIYRLLVFVMDAPGRISRKDIAARFGHAWASNVSLGCVLHVVGMNLTSYVNKATELKWPALRATFDTRTFDTLAGRISDLIWLEVLHCLNSHGDASRFVLVCESCLEVLLTFLLPPTMRWKRKAEPLERLCALVFVAKTLVWLRLNLRCRAACRLFPLFPPRIQAALLGDPHASSWLVAGTEIFFLLGTWVMVHVCISGLQEVLNISGWQGSGEQFHTGLVLSTVYLNI